MIIKVICVENTFKIQFSSFKIGQIYSVLNQDDTLLEITNNNVSSILVWKDRGEFKYSYDGRIIRFKKYNFRKEKLERILNG